MKYVTNNYNYFALIVCFSLLFFNIDTVDAKKVVLISPQQCIQECTKARCEFAYWKRSAPDSKSGRCLVTTHKRPNTTMKRPYNIWSPHLQRWLKHEDIGIYWPEPVEKTPEPGRKKRPDPSVKSNWKSGDCFNKFMEAKHGKLYPGYVLVVGFDALDGRLGCGVQRYGRSPKQIEQARKAAESQCETMVSNNPESCEVVAIAK